LVVTVTFSRAEGFSMHSRLSEAETTLMPRLSLIAYLSLSPLKDWDSLDRDGQKKLFTSRDGHTLEITLRGMREPARDDRDLLEAAGAAEETPRIDGIGAAGAAGGDTPGTDAAAGLGLGDSLIQDVVREELRQINPLESARANLGPSSGVAFCRKIGFVAEIFH
jgi:hypothetical protein